MSTQTPAPTEDQPEGHLLMDRRRVLHTIERMAYQLAEQNADAGHLVLVGIKRRGLLLAHRLADALRAIGGMDITVGHVRLNKDAPTTDEITTDLDVPATAGGTLVIVDDVAHTGRTLLFALKPFLCHTHKSIQVVVLIDRQHKTHPVSPDIAGLALSTTLHEHVQVVLDEGHEGVYVR